MDRRRAVEPGYDARRTVAWARAHRAELVDDLVAFVAMHELGHATGAYHHDPDDTEGAPDCPMRYWQMHDWDAILRWLGGEWRLTRSPREQAWSFCGENRPQMRLPCAGCELR